MIIMDLTLNEYIFLKKYPQIQFQYKHSKLIGSVGLGLILKGWQKLLPKTHEMEITSEGKTVE